jgi:hypothetical protein
MKVVKTAPNESRRVNENAIKTAKTRKVTAVVTVMSTFSEKDASCRALITEMRSLLAKRRKEPIFRRKIPADRETFLKNQEKARYRRN